MTAVPRAFAVETVELELAPLVGAFGRRLHDAGVPVSAERAARFAAALRLVGRAGTFSRRRLYWTARAVFVSDPAQVRIFDRVFAEVFGTSGALTGAPVIEHAYRAPAGEAYERPATETPPGPDARAEGSWGAGVGPAPSRGDAEPAEQELPGRSARLRRGGHPLQAL